MSIRTVDTNIQQAVCALINEMCGVNVSDVGSVDGQCECLVGAIVVCSSSDSISYLNCLEWR